MQNDPNDTIYYFDFKEHVKNIMDIGDEYLEIDSEETLNQFHYGRFYSENNNVKNIRFYFTLLLKYYCEQYILFKNPKSAQKENRNSIFKITNELSKKATEMKDINDEIEMYKQILKNLDKMFDENSLAGLPNDDEITRFIKNTSQASRGVDILDWWKRNECHFSTLSKYAVRSSSVASEVVFSASGNLIDSQKASLNDESIRSCMLLRSWIRAVG